MSGSEFYPLGVHKLVERLADGQEDAWDYWVGKYQRQLRIDIITSLRKWQVPVDCLDEIEQITFIKMFKLLREGKVEDGIQQPYVFGSEEKLYHWARVLARNAVWDVRHTLLRGATFFYQPPDEDTDQSIMLDTLLYVEKLNVEDTVSQTELAQVIQDAYQRALDQLNDRDCQIAQLSFYEEQKPREIAPLFDITPSHVSQILQRVKVIMRAHITSALLSQDLFSSVVGTRKRSSAPPVEPPFIEKREEQAPKEVEVRVKPGKKTAFREDGGR